MHIDDVVFHWPVSVGDLLYFHSQVVFTHENKVQTRVSAEVKDRKSHNLKLTNVMQITWELPEKVFTLQLLPWDISFDYEVNLLLFVGAFRNSQVLSRIYDVLDRKATFLIQVYHLFQFWDLFSGSWDNW